MNPVSNPNPKQKPGYQLIGEGSFGCVIKPTLPCDKNKEVYVNSTNKNRVSKVFKENTGDFLLEKTMAKKLSSINGSLNYFIYPFESCYINQDTLKKLNPKETCISDIDSTLIDVPQVILPYAGYDIYGLFKKYTAVSNNLKTTQLFPATIWITMLKNLFLGIELLIKNNIVHQDIYASNVLYDPKDSKLRFVDFGLAVNSKNVYTLSNKRLTYTYHCYPPEYMFAVFFKDKIYNPSFETVLSKWVNEYICVNPNTVDCYKFYSEYISDIQLHYELSLILQEYMISPMLWLTRMSKFTDLLDLYALGMLCIDVHERLDFSVLSMDQYKLYKTLVLGLMNPNYHKRFGFKDAYKFYMRLISSLNSTQKI